MTTDTEPTDAAARYLAEIGRDCEECLGPGARLLELRHEGAADAVRLVARYRLGGQEHESAAAGESLTDAHRVLRARILFDRIRFGFSDLV